MRSVLALAAAAVAFGQPQQETVWAPKPKRLPAYTAPHRPHVKLSDLDAKFRGKADWRETVMDDEHMKAEYVSAAPGTKSAPRFHPDTREWWMVLRGEMRFRIQGQAEIVARKGSMVQVPMQTIYSWEVTGSEPALRLEVNIAQAKTLFPKDVSPPPMPGFDWIQVKMPWRPVPYDKVNRPHQTFAEFESRVKYDHRGLSVEPVVADDRGAMNFIYGFEKNIAPLDPKDPGHYHPECAEAWIIAKGQMRYGIEGHGVVIANEGDFVYVPKFLFHSPRFHGEGPSCRISLNGYPKISHLAAH
ncbi:MAG: cupin domain-containing protein [Bryobacteraceae bacterium]